MALCEALSQAHEPETYRKLSRDITLQSPVASVQEVREVLRREGLTLEGDVGEDFEGRMSKGVVITPLELIARLRPPQTIESGFVLENDRVRMMRWERALMYWTQKLDEN